MIAALFVETGGVYYGIEDVIPWDIRKDARKYDGPYAVVAHPPCERWGNYWFGSPSSSVRYKLGDDGGCFSSAIDSVRKYGGVIEHPYNSRAWKVFGLRTPGRIGTWIKADEYGYTCCVSQGRYGHASQKLTWLYAVKTVLPRLEATIIKDYHTPCELLSRKERMKTPLPFRDILLTMARSVHA